MGKQRTKQTHNINHTMTPEKILDLGVKIGVVPFMFYIIMLTRSDVKELQMALKDCYLQMNNLSENPRQSQNRIIYKPLAILPSQIKIEEETV